MLLSGPKASFYPFCSPNQSSNGFFRRVRPQAVCGGGGSWGFGPYFGCFPPRSVAQSSGSAAQRARGGLWAPLGSWSSSGGLGEAGREETSLGTKQGSGRPLEEVSAPSVQKGRCGCPGRPGWGWMDEAGKRPAGFFWQRSLLPALLPREDDAAAGLLPAAVSLQLLLGPGARGHRCQHQGGLESRDLGSPGPGGW